MDPGSAHAETTLVIDDYLARQRRVIDDALDRFLPPATEAPTSLHDAMRYAVFGGGKRLRPVCCLLACEAVGGAAESAIPAACALEMIHTYSLVHDDLPCMDDDDMRRGRKTVHKVYGEAIGVLAGDALLTHAFEVIGAELPPAVSGQVARAIARAAGSRGMVGGQVGDLEAEGRALAEDEVLSIDSRKTAALFSAAFEAGGWCGGATPEQAHALGELGRELGIAFQIVDDLLDLTASPEAMGKATGKDQKRGKATLPSLLGQDAAFERARSHSERARRLASTLQRRELIETLIQTMLSRSH